MTIHRKIALANKMKNVREHLDYNSQNLYILEPLAEKLGLSIVSKESIVHTLLHLHTQFIFIIIDKI